ncbi:Hsp20/alpha crystallin family protein [Caproicibacter sp.]|uniref:Hsp20/alpha crystallin family protein n=1 Tax=Caproicibacter sp. TaxID=2814884 RepID=UPI00398A492D
MFDLIPFDRGTDGLFDEFSRFMNGGFWNGTDSFQTFRTDILDKGDKYIMRADLPGFQKQEININVEGDCLTLNAEHKEEVNENKKNYIRKERRYGAFSRSFDLSGIDSAGICARYSDGVLELELPKSAQAKSSQKRIEVK